jgi:hypothetical protein
VERAPWREALADPLIQATIVYSIAALAAAVAAYYTVFTIFAPYDDEGTLLVTVQAFAKGHVLYRDIYSPYGPFYYEVFGGLFALTGKAVTTDASRTIVVVFWVTSSLLFGIAAQRLTGRLALGVAGMAAAFGTLFVLADEPMHPQVLGALLLGAITLLVAFGPSRRPAAAGAAAGALAAGLVLTKLNIGAYAVAAAVLAAVLTLEPLRSRAWIRWPVVALIVVAMPIFVAARDLDLEWVRSLVAVQVLTMAAVVVASWRLGAERRDQGLGRWLLAAVAGFAVAFVAILVTIMLAGSSPSDIYDGMVTEALRVRDVSTSEFPMNTAMVDWAIAALALAFLALRLRRAEAGPPALWSGVTRIIAGIAIWLSIARIAPLSVGPSIGNQISLAMVLAWIATIPPGGVVEAPFKRFLRLFLPALAIADALQVYPVAGSQVGNAALLFVPVGAICLGDGLTVLRAWSAERGRDGLERFGVAAAVLLAALAVDMGLKTIVRPAASARSIYHSEPALPFKGATDVHLSEEQVQMYTTLVNDLHEYGCTNFIGYPNVNSLYLWSGIEPPAPAAPGVWLEALDSERQQRVVNELRATKKPCVIRSENRAELWLAGRPVPQRPLVRYIFGNFRPVQTVGEFEFMLPKPSATSSAGSQSPQ